MKPVLPISDLTIYRKDIPIIRATAEQIIKDFEIFGEEIHFSGIPETAYIELKTQILPVVSKLMNYNYEKFLSLLYRIDINERKLQEITRTQDGTYEELVTEMIIERELKKVLVRKFFSEK